MSWTVYMLECADKTLYTGIAKDMARRLDQHVKGSGAKYTRARLPVRLVYTEKRPTRGDALKREAEIKSLTRSAKLALAAK